MPLPVLAPVIEGLVVDAAVRAGRALLARLPWAKDSHRVSEVESRIRRLAADVAESARALGDEAIEPQFQRLLAQFERDLAALGVPTEQAEQITQAERDQLRATVLEPVREQRHTIKWLQDLEARANRADQAIADCEKITLRLIDLERRTTRLAILATVSLTLATVATLLCLSIFTRR